MIKKWIDKIWKLPIIKQIVALSSKIHPIGFEGLSIYDVARFFYDSINKGAIITRASAISFKLIMASLPALIVLISFIPLIVPDFVENLKFFMAQAMPAQTLEFLNPYLEQLFSRGAGIVSIGFVLALIYSTSAVQSIFNAFGNSINITTKPSVLIQQLFSFAILFIMAILIIVGLSSITLLNQAVDSLQQREFFNSKFWVYVFYFLNYIIIFLLFSFAISTLYNMGNPERKRWRFFSVGATAASIFMIIVSAGFAYYVNNFGNYNKLYGSIGAIVVFFFWIYYNSIILLIGFELNLSINKAKSEIQQLKS